MICYVSMTDEFMTWYWSKRSGIKAVLVFYCFSELAADIVADNAETRGDMSDITIHRMPPVFSQHVHVTCVNHNSYPKWYYRNSVKIMGD